MMLAAVLAVLLADPTPEKLKYLETPDAVYEPVDPKLGSYYSISISPDGKLVAAGSFKEVVVWDTASKKQVATIRGAGMAIAFSPKEDLLAIGMGGGITLTSTTTWKLKDTLTYSGGIYRLAFSPDGTLALTGGPFGDGDVVVWNVAKGIRETRIHLLDDAPVQALASSGKQFAVTVKNKIKLFDHERCKEIRELAGHVKQVTGLAFSPDGSKLASVSPSDDLKPGPQWWWVDETNTKLWDVATGKQLPLPMKTMQGFLNCVSWSADGKYLAISDSTHVQVIDFKNPKQVIAINAYAKCKSGSEAICFSPDGKYLYTAGKSRPVTRWKLDAPAEPLPGSGPRPK